MLEMIDTSTQQKNPLQQSIPITLLPGSRPQEFKLYFKIMLETLMVLKQEFSNIAPTICVSSPHFKPLIKKYLTNYPLLKCQTSTTSSIEEMKKSSLIISASGSATLEAVILKKPLIVLAALPPITYFIAKYILKINLPYYSLPNVISETETVPEFVQSKMIPANIAKQAKILIEDPKDQIKKYSHTIKCLTHSPNVYNKITKEILN